MALWVRVVAVVGLLAAPLLVLASMMIAAHELTIYERSFGVFGPLFRAELSLYLPSLVMAGLIAVSLIPGSKATRWARWSVIAVVAQVFAIGFAATLWWIVGPQIDMESHLPLARSLSLAPVCVFAVGVLGASALPPRTVLPFVRGTVVFLLTQLLALGLLLPYVTRFAPLDWDAYTASYPVCVVLLSVAVATSAIFAARRREWVERNRKRIRAAFVVLLAGAILLMPGPEHPGSFAYSNLAFVMVAEVLIVLACVISFTILQWRWLRVRRPRAGTLEGSAQAVDGDVVGWVRYRGWLRGLVAETAQFRVRTKHGPVVVPAGSRMVAPTPPSTVSLQPGERTPALRAGEWVVVAGFEARAVDGPYRGTVVPGSAGVTAWAAGPKRTLTLWEVLLWVWRPCVLYLAVTTAVALPGVVTAATPYDADQLRELIHPSRRAWHRPTAGLVIRNSEMSGYCNVRRSRPRVSPGVEISRENLADEFNFAATCWSLSHTGCPELWDIVPHTFFSAPLVPGTDELEVLCNAVPPRDIQVRLRGSSARFVPLTPRGWKADDWLSRQQLIWIRNQRSRATRAIYRLTRAYQYWTQQTTDDCPRSIDDIVAHAPYREETVPLHRDPWGNEYLFECGSNLGERHYGFVVRSKGRDGKQGTADDIERGVRDPRNERPRLAN